MSRRPLKGRVLEASRDIKEGELVIFDKALAVVPNAEPVCLGCLRIISTSTNNLNNERYAESNFVCEECKFPLCGKKDCEPGPTDAHGHANNSDTRAPLTGPPRL